MIMCIKPPLVGQCIGRAVMEVRSNAQRGNPVTWRTPSAAVKTGMPFVGLVGPYNAVFGCGSGWE